MEQVNIDRYNGLPLSYSFLVNSPEVKKLLEGLEGITDSIIDSSSLNLSHLDKEVKYNGIEYNISVQ